MLRHALYQNKRSAHIYIDHIIEFLERYVPYLGHAFAIAGVGDENVWSLAVLAVDFGKHILDLVCLADVNFVDGYAQGFVCLFELVHQRHDAGEAGHVC